MYETIFLIVLGFLYLIFASWQDLKMREVANWLNFSLIIFALIFRAIYSILNSNYNFFLYGLFGFGIFVIIANLFYYSRVFAGGDAKLLMGLGAILPLSFGFYGNFLYLMFFVFLFMLSGSAYSLVYGSVLVFRNYNKFSKEFKKQVYLWKNFFYISFFFAFLSFVFILVDYAFIVLPFTLFLLPFLFCYAKSIEESCLIKLINPKDIVIGDWLYKKIRVGKQVLKPDWQGLCEEEVELIKKSRNKILIKYGVPFVPSFLIAFIFYVWLYYLGIGLIEFLFWII